MPGTKGETGVEVYFTDIRKRNLIDIFIFIFLFQDMYCQIKQKILWHLIG